jgi:hypothetical protein
MTSRRLWPFAAARSIIAARQWWIWKHEMTAQQWTESARREWACSHVRLGQVGPTFPTTAPDQTWRARFETMQADRALPASIDMQADDDFRCLVEAAKLSLDGVIAFGGWAVCHAPLDSDLDRVVARGILLDGAGAQQVRGRPSDCHRNSARIWMARQSAAAVMTGYALSDDGMWRAHSWVAALDRNGTPGLLETTEPRLAYFGFLRSREEALELLDDNDRFDSPKDRLEDMRERLLAIEPGSAFAGIR